MTTLLRLESNDPMDLRDNGIHRGIYRCCDTQVFNIMGQDDTLHPVPEKDSKLCPKWEYLPNQADWHFGFTSIDQLKRWFYSIEVLDYLRDTLHIELVEYTTDDVIDGYTQCVFDSTQPFTRKVLNKGDLL